MSPPGGTVGFVKKNDRMYIHLVLVNKTLVERRFEMTFGGLIVS